MTIGLLQARVDKAYLPLMSRTEKELNILTTILRMLPIISKKTRLKWFNDTRQFSFHHVHEFVLNEM